jgi:hypothetical protein
MRRRHIPFLCLMGAYVAAGTASGQDTGAKGNGNWATPATWTTGAVPGASNNVYIGSTAPNGAAAKATVTLTTDASAANVFLGNGKNTDGTLVLGANASLSIGTSLVIGQNGGTGTLSEAGGSFTAQTVSVEGNNSLSFGAGDSASDLILSGGARATTAAGGNITTNATIGTGSTLTLGANANLSGSLAVQDSGSTLNMDFYTLKADALLLGFNGLSDVNLTNRGILEVETLSMGNGQELTLKAGDRIGQFDLTGAGTTLTNFVPANISTGGTVAAGSTLNLDSNMSITGTLDVENIGSTLNMNGHSLSATFLTLGYAQSDPVTVENRGALSVATLEVYQTAAQTFNIDPGDKVSSFTLSGGVSNLYASVGALKLTNGAFANTQLPGTVTSSVDILSGSTLNLGGPLNLGALGVIAIDGKGSTLNGGNLPITTGEFKLSDNASATNLGKVQASVLNLAGGSTLTLHGGDVMSSQIELQGGSTLTVQQTNGKGLTLDGNDKNSLTIADTSKMSLVFANNNTAANWDFRWMDPMGGNWINTINTMIKDKQIVVTAPQGYQVVDMNGYTYVEGKFATPEPSTLVLALIGGVAIALRTAWRSRRSGLRCRGRGVEARGKTSSSANTQ